MKYFFFIFSYITLTNAFSYIITSNNICAKSKINLRMQNKENKERFYLKNLKKLDYPKLGSKNSETFIILDNRGFDPLNCASDINTLKKYKNAEIKNCRLSFLASIY